MEAPIKILRDCDSTLIPSGDKITLIKGTLVRITQALGGDYTLYVNGNLVKLSGKDADAIGKKAEDNTNKSLQINNGEYSEDLVWEQLRTCYDPEIPVDIYSLGLVYNIEVKVVEEVKDVKIDMTLTSPACPVAETLPPEIESKIRGACSSNNS